MINKSVVLGILVAATFSFSGIHLNASEPSEARVFFIYPKDKAKVGQEIHVKMGVQGRAICPAGPETADKTCGHHHILVDSAFVPEGQVVAKDETHLHFGKGETEAHLKLKPGKHKLTLQFADFAHRSYGEKLSQTIEVDVK